MECKFNYTKWRVYNGSDYDASCCIRNNWNIDGAIPSLCFKKFEVEVDPKVEAILAVLPGANCGACGFPGCAGYASGVALEGLKDDFMCTWRDLRLLKK